MVALTLGIGAFTWLYLAGAPDKSGMSYVEYKDWITLLLSLVSLISNAAIGFYFAEKPSSKPPH
jgi:hypothetical protein